MPTNKYLNVKDLKLDLKNYRTVPQNNEVDAINAMIAIKPDRFYAVVESIIENGYLPTENLIILHDNDYVVKEGNRRAAALKLIFGIHNGKNFNLPDSLRSKINSVTKEWKKENERVPCNVYSLAEKHKVDKIINLTHAKGEKASRDHWTSVAKARQNRDEKKGAEPSLDLLEKYLLQGQNLTNQQKERWSGDYPYTVLEEALRHVHSRLGHESISDLAKSYPQINSREKLEEILRDIGLEFLGFKEIRSSEDTFHLNYGLTPISGSDEEEKKTDTVSSEDVHNQQNISTNASPIGSVQSQVGQNEASNLSHGASLTGFALQPVRGPKKDIAYAICDQKHVNQVLKKFSPQGSNRQKIVSLRDELKKLKVSDNPIAFCFLLRSMFEISAVIYCEENSISTTEGKKGGEKNKDLKSLLSAVTDNLTQNSKNKPMVKVLHGAKAELTKSEGFLSVTSLNQLVHNRTFSIAPADIFTLFNNVYPLLEAMN